MRLLPILSVFLLVAAPPAWAAPARAVLAGGCFWSMEKAMDQAPGVSDVKAGYTGGTIDHPTYQDYHDAGPGITPHVEAVEVTYDTDKTSYAQLLDYYFHHIDPTEGRGQICDFGPGYKPVIFVSGDDEEKTAQAVKDAIGEELDRPVAVEIRRAGAFWPAEDYHQDYYKKNPAAYARYRAGCGRDRKLEEIWDK